MRKIAKLERERSHFENTTAGQETGRQAGNQTIILQKHLGNRNRSRSSKGKMKTKTIYFFFFIRSENYRGFM